MSKIIRISAVALALIIGASAQLSTTNTTLSVAVPASVTQQWCVASATGVNTPSMSQTGSILFADKEAAQVIGAGSSATCFVVKRGQLGTSANAAHASGTKVWVGSAATSSADSSRPFSGAFVTAPPSGSCVASAQYTLPVIVTGGASQVYAGDLYRCVAGMWARGDSQQTPQLQYTTFATIASSIAANSTTQAAGTIWFSQINVPQNATLTGACILNGAGVTNDKYIVALYDAAGTLLANSATAGTTTAGASVYQCIAFTATIDAVGPASYFVALQTNGTTDTFATYAAGAAPTKYLTTNKTGTFGTLTALTVPTAFAANKGPIMMVY